MNNCDFCNEEIDAYHMFCSDCANCIIACAMELSGIMMHELEKKILKLAKKQSKQIKKSRNK